MLCCCCCRKIHAKGPSLNVNSSFNQKESEMEWERFFQQNEEPKDIDRVKNSVDEFCNYFCEQTRFTIPIVLVTSGGTTIPFEQNMVRFIDNFSAGTRGSASVEYFLRKGYAAIFLHRSTSLKPFARHFAGNVLDILEKDDLRNTVMVGF